MGIDFKFSCPFPTTSFTISFILSFIHLFIHSLSPTGSGGDLPSVGRRREFLRVFAWTIGDDFPDFRHGFRGETVAFQKRRTQQNRAHGFGLGAKVPHRSRGYCQVRVVRIVSQEIFVLGLDTELPHCSRGYCQVRVSAESCAWLWSQRKRASSLLGILPGEGLSRMVCMALVSAQKCLIALGDIAR